MWVWSTLSYIPWLPPEASGKPVSLLEFFVPKSTHQTFTAPDTQTLVTFQPNTNPILGICPLVSQQERPSIVTDESVFSTPKPSLVRPQLEPVRQVRKIDKGVFRSHTLASLKCEFNLTPSFVSESAGKPISLPNNLSQESVQQIRGGPHQHISGPRRGWRRQAHQPKNLSQPDIIGT